jgi:hypothetical protein
MLMIVIVTKIHINISTCIFCRRINLFRVNTQYIFTVLQIKLLLIALMMHLNDPVDNF